MRVVWLAPYPIDRLTPELTISRNIGGHAASWIANLSNELVKQRDMELHIVTHAPNIPYSQKIIKNDIIFHVIRYCFPFTKNKGFPSYLPLNVFTWYKGFVDKALKIISDIKPDIVHAHGTEGAFALTACDSELCSIVSIQGIITEYNKISPSLSYWLQIPIEKYAIEKSNNFGCRTNWDKNFVKNVNKKATIFYMPEAIDSMFFQHDWTPSKSLSILFVGYLSKRKGIEILLESISIVKKSFQTIILNVVGSGSKKYVAYLKEFSRNLNIEDNIIWHGVQKPEEIAEHLSNNSVFVLPTFMDNSPNSLAEAMAVGIPCIASDAGGIPSMIGDNKNGVLFPSGDSITLAKKIVNLLSDQEFMTKISKHAKITAYNKFYKDIVVEQTIKVYEEIVSRNIVNISGL